MTTNRSPVRYHLVSFLAGLLIFIGAFHALQLATANASTWEVGRAIGVGVSGITLLFSARLLRDAG